MKYKCNNCERSLYGTFTWHNDRRGWLCDDCRITVEKEQRDTPSVQDCVNLLNAT